MSKKEDGNPDKCSIASFQANDSSKPMISNTPGPCSSRWESYRPPNLTREEAPEVFENLSKICWERST